MESFDTMSSWVPDLNPDVFPLYKAIAESIRDAIQKGELKPGQRLLPHRRMAKQLGLNIGTVARGYNLASSWGLTASKVGQGTVVRDQEENYQQIPIQLNGSYFRLGILQPSPITDVELRKAAYEDTLKVIGQIWKNQFLGGYPPEFGHKHHREAGAAWIGRTGIQSTPDEVLVTLGTQEAFHLLLSVYTSPGDIVLAEKCTHNAIKDLGKFLGLEMVGIDMDDQGLLPDALDAAAARTRAQILFLTPTYHSPTTITTSADRRLEIVEVARRNNLFIIENDPYSELIENAPAPIALYAPERTAYVTSLSLFGPAEIRIGYLKVPLKNVPELQSAKRALSIAGPLVTAEIATQWINTGILERLLHWQIEEIKIRAELASQILKQSAYRYSPNGLFLWLNLPEPWRATDFAAVARERNVIVLESERFVIGRGVAPHAIRIALSTAQNRDLLQQGLRIIVDLIRHPARKNPLD